jgi:hypothetical protein
MTNNMNELLPMPGDLLLKNLDALIQLMVIVEASALILIVIIFAILAWSFPGKIKRTDCN